MQIPNAQVSLFGLVRLQAKFLPYVNLLIDLIVGGPMYALESATGLAAGYIWFYVTGVRRPPPTSRDGRAHLDRFLAKYIAPLFETPRRVRRLITGDGAVRQRSYGTAYSPGVPPASSSKGYWWPFGPAAKRLAATAQACAHARPLGLTATRSVRRPKRVCGRIVLASYLHSTPCCSTASCAPSAQPSSNSPIFLASVTLRLSSSS